MNGDRMVDTGNQDTDLGGVDTDMGEAAPDTDMGGDWGKSPDAPETPDHPSDENGWITTHPHPNVETEPSPEREPISIPPEQESPSGPPEGWSPGGSEGRW